VNLGVSIVVPAKKSLETPYHPELVAMRKERWERENKNQQPVADSAIKPAFTKADFEAALPPLRLSRQTRIGF
jgi:hypothetical protein